MQLLTLKQVCSRLSISRKTIERMVKARSFPVPLKFGTALRWEEEVIDKFISEKRSLNLPKQSRYEIDMGGEA